MKTLTIEQKEFLVNVLDSRILNIQHQNKKFYNWNVSLNIEDIKMEGGMWAGLRVKDWINSILNDNYYYENSDKKFLNSVRTFYIKYDSIIKINGQI